MYATNQRTAFDKGKKTLAYIERPGMMNARQTREIKTQKSNQSNVSYPLFL